MVETTFQPKKPQFLDWVRVLSVMYIGLLILFSIVEYFHDSHDPLLTHIRDGGSRLAGLFLVFGVPFSTLFALLAKGFGFPFIEPDPIFGGKRMSSWIFVVTMSFVFGALGLCTWAVLGMVLGDFSFT
jgi:hypothetical protein